MFQANVADLPGIRWEERGWQLDDTLLLGAPGSAASSIGGGGNRVTSARGSAFYLHPTTTCLNALHILNEAWSTAGLACLPVAMDNGRGFQGMLTKQDILVSYRASLVYVHSM